MEFSIEVVENDDCVLKVQRIWRIPKGHKSNSSLFLLALFRTSHVEKAEVGGSRYSSSSHRVQSGWVLADDRPGGQGRAGTPHGFCVHKDPL